MIRTLALLVAGLALAGAARAQEDLTRWVDPMIGTGGTGHTFPGATTPFGMVQLSPSNSERGWQRASGYHYDDTVIEGFAHTHLSGAGLTTLGDILLRPARSSATATTRVHFSHARESASPGYYRVHLDEPNVDAELTASPRTGFHRYTYTGAGARYVVIDPVHSILDFTTASGIRIVSDREIRGYKRSFSQSSGTRSVYFVARFSQPFVAAGITDANRSVAGRARDGRRVRAYVRFPDGAGAVEAAVAISHVSAAGAATNFAVEGVGTTFDRAHAAARVAWQDWLARVTIDEPSPVKRRIFYTASYHAAIAPNLISDVDGAYHVAGRVRRSTIAQFSNFSTWDTFRAQAPLLTIVDPERAGWIVASMVSRHADAGLLLPSWEAVGHDNRVMIGYSMAAVIADAVVKRVPGVDPQAAYAAIRASAFDRTIDSNVYDANGMDDYLRYGFVGAGVASSVSKTTEQNYEDWAIGRVAAMLGRTDDAALFARRATGWRNLYDAASGNLVPRFDDGRFVAMRADRWDDLNQHYVSGNIWAYSAFTPHDMVAAIRLHGGRAAYARWLEAIFTDARPIEGEQHVDLSGFVGRYGHGDEPGHQMAYLFNLIGRPWLTQAYVNRIVRTMYADTPTGLVNNDDLGQMSAWYVLSTLGFYPVAPGEPVYQIGAPYHRRASIGVGGGRRFVIEAANLSDANIYIQSATLNGVPFDRSFITHDQVMAGGVLRFAMGPRPNTGWASRAGASSLGAFDDRAPVAIERTAPWAPYDPDPRAGFLTDRRIVLRAEPGAAIRYTRDGSAPDQQARFYDSPLTANRDVLLRALAVDSRGVSATFRDRYVRTVMAGLPAGYPRIALAEPDVGYGRRDGSLLFDQRFGTRFYADRRWTGRKGDLTATIDLGVARAARTLTVGYLDDAINGIVIPRHVTVWGGDDAGSLVRLADRAFLPFAGVRQTPGTLALALPGRPYRYWRVTVTGAGTVPTAISEPGVPAWLFLDEILLQ